MTVPSVTGGMSSKQLPYTVERNLGPYDAHVILRLNMVIVSVLCNIGDTKECFRVSEALV